MVALANIVVDPLFHYHAPIKGVNYTLDDERYQNNGIVKHYTYDAMITGTSMTENFKTSQMDELFGTNGIKTCFMGGSYKEISDNIRVALEYNPELKLVIRATDQFDIINNPDKHPSTDPETTFEYPWFIIDDNIFNDVEYVLNKALLSDTLKAVKQTISHVNIRNPILIHISKTYASKMDTMWIGTKMVTCVLFTTSLPLARIPLIISPAKIIALQCLFSYVFLRIGETMPSPLCHCTKRYTIPI